MQTSNNDTRIWALAAGSVLAATRDLIMEDGGERAYTSGQTYVVSSMHPVADPPFVVALDDQGLPHRLAGEDVAKYFQARP